MANTGSTTAVAESPKVSMMAKAGLNFVIPKNKLSGAMIPVNKGSTKWEPMDAKKEESKPPARKTKWGSDLTQDPSVKRGRALALQTRAEQLAAQLESGSLDIDSNEDSRSPSPPPLYDTLGHRMNTREGRKRDLLDLERREAIGECMKLNSAYKPPSGFKPVSKEAKLYIPVKEHPGYNFIGLVLGPRGNTQKRMESETGAKITIRGKGAVKEGKMQSARIGKEMDGAFEELHVHISADSFEKVDAAVALIEPLLTPVDEDRNMHKMKQLRELAEMNGTLTDYAKACGLCGEDGHREWQCPKDKLQTFQANVICQICGDGGHPTIDCPRKSSGQAITFDKEYLTFLEEVGTGLQSASSSATADHPSDANTSHPMLLTTLGVQPVPPRWIAPIGIDPAISFAPRGLPDGSSHSGVPPRFPNLPGIQGMPPRFLIPPGSQGTFLNPPGPQGMNSFLPRFPQSGMVPSGFPRGQSFPVPAFPTAARTLSATGGQVPFSPAGFAGDMRPPIPPVIPTGMLPAPSAINSTSMQTQTSGIGNEGAIRGPQSVSSTQVGNEREISNAVPVVSPMQGAPSPLSSMVFHGTALPGGSSRTPPTFVSSAVRPFQATAQPVPAPLTSHPDIARPMLPPAPINMVAPPPMIPPMRPVSPSIRPILPSVRPMPSNAVQGSGMAGGPGQGPPNGIPTFGGTLSDTLLPGNNHLPGQQCLTGGLPVQGQNQYPGPIPSSQQPASTLDKPSFTPLRHPFPPPWSTPPPPMSARMSGSMPLSDSMQGQTIIRTPPVLFPPTVSPNFLPPRTPQSQFVTSPSNQLAAQSSSHSSPRPAFPPMPGSQVRPVNSPSAVPSIGGNSPLSSSGHQIVASQQNLLHQPQDPNRPSILLNPQPSRQGVAFPRADFSPARHIVPVPVGVQLRAELRSPVPQQSGIPVPPMSILGNPGFNRPPIQMSPQDTLNRGYSSGFSHPATPTNTMPIAAGGSGAVIPPWDPSLAYRNRPDMLQLQGQQSMAVNSSRNADPHMRPPPSLNVPMAQTSEVDPEYEKLMASVGVL